MSYTDQTLGRNESLHYKARLPTFRYVLAWSLLALILAASVASISYIGWAAAIAALVGLCLFLAIMVPIWTTEISVTSQRLIYKRGFLRRTTKELQLRAVEEANLEQGLLGRMLNYGRIELHGTGVDDIDLPALADPVGVQRAIQEAIGPGVQSGAGLHPAISAEPSAPEDQPPSGTDLRYVGRHNVSR